jgi:hypothetical protein
MQEAEGDPGVTLLSLTELHDIIRTIVQDEATNKEAVIEKYKEPQEGYILFQVQ